MKNGQTVYVVCASEGEYSDRIVWVAGAFLTEQEAKNKIEEKMAQHRIWKTWHESYLKIYDSLYISKREMLDRISSFSNEWDETITKIQKEAKAKTDPEPKRESAEQLWIEEAKVGEWVNEP